jgi:hypothetical protein
VRPTQIAQNVPPPPLGDSVTVPAGEGVRLVYGSFRVAATALVGASVEGQVETAPASEQYATVARKSVAPKKGVGVSASTADDAFFFSVPAGCRYRFVGTGAAGIVEAVLHYSYVDL